MDASLSEAAMGFVFLFCRLDFAIRAARLPHGFFEIALHPSIVFIMAILDAVWAFNAAIFASLPQRPFYEIPFDEWNKVMHVNITGSYLCASAVARPMKAAGQGRIINISSGTVPQGVPGFMHYVTSKSAITSGRPRAPKERRGAEKS